MPLTFKPLSENEGAKAPNWIRRLIPHRTRKALVRFWRVLKLLSNLFFAGLFVLLVAAAVHDFFRVWPLPIEDVVFALFLCGVVGCVIWDARTRRASP